MSKKNVNRVNGISSQTPAVLFYLWQAIIWIAAAACVQAAANRPPEAPTGLLMELLSEPLGLENLNPSMGWIVNDADPDECQTAYQILVSDCPNRLTEDKGNLWDSGKLCSCESSNVRYAGYPLKPDQIYYWKVRTWDKNDQAGIYSQPQRFTTAVKDQWTAIPVWGNGRAESEPNFLFLRKSFVLPDKKIQSAIAHVTALSPEPASQYVYKLYTNGTLVGAGPQRGFDDVNRYNTFDVKSLLRPGKENIIAAINYTTQDKRFLFQMTIIYGDGSAQTVKSDRTWKTLDGDRIYRDQGNAGNGTYYYAPREGLDARHYPFGWNDAEYDDSEWIPAIEKETIESLKASSTLNTRIGLVKPVRVIHKGDNNYFVEFKENVVAGIRLNVEGRTGHQLEIRLGEELSAPETVRDMRTGNTYREVWTLKDGRQVLEHFGYRVFRYAEIFNAPRGFSEENIDAAVMRYPFNDHAADFKCSDKTLNDVWELCKYSIKGNALDVFVDSHTRERRNYEPDALIWQLSRYSVDREYAFARYSIEYLYHRSTWPTEGKLQSIAMACNDFLYTGNKDSLYRNYDILKGKVLEPFINEDFLVEKPENSRQYGRDLVDWPGSQRDGYEFSSINTVVNAFNYRAIDGLRRIAEALGYNEDARRYELLAQKLKAAINAHLYDSAKGCYKDGKMSDHYSLHASAFALALGVVTPDNMSAVADYVQSRGMAVSVYGAHYLLEGLYQTGRGQAALNLMTAKSGNSWGHMIYDLHATMVGEAWDPSLKGNMGFSNPWASAPANAVPRGLFGVIPLEPAFNRFQIKPQPAALNWATLTVPTIKGPIRVEFKKNENLFEMTVHVPVNTRAKVYVPIMNSNGFVVKKNDSPAEGAIENGYMVFPEVGSGRHVFQSSDTSVHAGN